MSVNKHPQLRRGEPIPSAAQFNAMADASSEADRLSAIHPARSKPVEIQCVTARFGPQGPEIDHDWPDARYWVRQINYVRDGSGVPQSLATLGAPLAAIWTTATNLSEVDAGTHGLPPDTFVLVREIRDDAGNPAFVFSGASSEASAAIQDVKIAYIVDCSQPGDCPDEQETNHWNVMGAHLKTFPMAGIFCDLDTTVSYIPVLPNCKHWIAQFNTVAWSITDSNQPVFTVFRDGPAWRMIFGEGERWVDAPTDVCGEQPGGKEGACCEEDGSCTDDVNQQDCEFNGGSFQGAGTTCSGFGDICVQPDIGACCCVQGTDCWNDQFPSEPVTCWANQTQADCESQGGVYQGNNSVCGGQPGICGDFEPNGACCLPEPPGSCVLQPDAEACKFMGGLWVGGPCDPNPCPPPTFGACCVDGDCTQHTEDFCINNLGGVWLGPEACDPNPCKQPVGWCCHPVFGCIPDTEKVCVDNEGGTWDPDVCPPPC